MEMVDTPSSSTVSTVAHPRLLPTPHRTTMASRNPQPSPTRYSFSFNELYQVLYLQREVENVKLDDIKQPTTQPSSPDKKPVLKNKETLATCETCRGQPKAECSEHGPLFFPRKLKSKSDIQLSYAVSSFPDEVQLCWSSVPCSGYGVSAKQHIPIGTWIGPYEGRRTRPEDVTSDMDTSYMWEIFQDGRLVCYLDASDENTSSWMRFIRCARHRDEQNLYAFQYCGNIYYRAFRNISVGQELLVWYDEKYQQHMGLPLNIQDMAVVDPNGNKCLFDLMAGNVKPPINDQHVNYTPPVTQPIPVTVTQHTPTNVVHQVPVAVRHQVTANAAQHHPVGFSQPIAKGPPQRAIPVTQHAVKVTQYQPANVTHPVLVSCTTKYPIVVTAPVSTTVIETDSKKCNNDAMMRKIPISATQHSSVTVTQPITPVNPISPSKRKKLLDQHILTQEVKHLKTFHDTHARDENYNIDSTIIPHGKTIDLPHVHEVIPGFENILADEYVDDEMSDSADRSMWQCGQCQQSFTQRALLQIHVCQGMPNRPYKCGHCADSFSHPNELRTHVVKHTNEKPFKCGYCSRSFAGTTTLNNHIRTHTGEKPYICSKCRKVFSTASQLSRHQKIPSECI